MKILKNILILFAVSLLLGCAEIPLDQTAQNSPDFTYMNKDNAPGVVVVVPPSEIRTLREMVIENRARLEKAEADILNVDVKASVALDNQSIFGNLLQALSYKIEDYRRACEAMFEKILKK